MSDRKKYNVSETFGKYAHQGSKGGKKGSEPKNITSDMWIPISAGQSEEKVPAKNPPAEKKTSAKASPQKSAAQKSSSENRQNKKEPSLISEGRKNEDKAPKKAKKKKSRTPKGRPVSEISPGGPSSKKQQSDRIRHHQQLSKAERDYDDRIREGKSPSELSKERAEAKRKRRRRRNILSVAVFLAFVLAFVGVYTYSKGAPVAVFTVEGESIYSDEEILDAAGLEIGVNMFSVKEKNINGLVTRLLPYIHSVEISRKLPDKLTLTVTPTTEKYLIANSENYICVDGYGKVVSDKNKRLDTGLYRIYGIGDQSCQIGTEFVPDESNTERYEFVKRLVSAMEQEGVMTRGTVNVSDLKNVRIYYVYGETKIMVYLGSCNDLESRISLASKVISSPETMGKTGYIDMRFSNAAYFNEGSLKLK